MQDIISNKMDSLSSSTILFIYLRLL